MPPIDVIHPLMLTEQPAYERFSKMVLSDIAAAYQLPREAFGVDQFVIMRELSDKIFAKALETYHRQRERHAAIYLFGYDPQMLLEDRRADRRRALERVRCRSTR